MDRLVLVRARVGILAVVLGWAQAGCADYRSDEGEGAVTADEVGTADEGTSGESGPVLDLGNEGMMEAGDDEGVGEGTACEQAAKAESNQGCEFWAVDLPNAWQVTLAQAAQDQTFAIVVTNTASEPATVEIFAADEAVPLQSDVVAPGALRVFAFGNELGIANQGNTEGRAYRIESDQPVTAYQFNPLDNSTEVYSNDASLLFPTHVLDLDYTAITGDGIYLYPDAEHEGGNAGAYVTAVATQDDTYVTFHAPPGVPMYPGNYVAVLDRGETYTMMSNAVDTLFMNQAGQGNLSGLRVEADKPVAVFSGNVAAFEPTPWGACCADHLEHQMLPLTAWSDAYLVSTAPPASGSDDDDVRVRIVGSFDGTQLSYSPSAPPGAPTTIDAYATAVFTTSSSFVVTGDRPFAVAQFLMSNEAITVDPTPEDPDDNFFVGDPAMILVPPAAQFQAKYVFLVPAEYETNWVTILRPSGATVSLDGVDQTNAGGWQNVGTLAGTTWQRAHFPLAFGPHRVESPAPEGVGILVAGYDVAVSFGYAGGSGVEFQDDAPPPPPIP